MNLKVFIIFQVYQKNEYLKQLEFLTNQNIILENQINEEEKQVILLEKEKNELKEQNKQMSMLNNKKIKNKNIYK